MVIKKNNKVNRQIIGKEYVNFFFPYLLLDSNWIRIITKMIYDTIYFITTTLVDFQ